MTHRLHVSSCLGRGLQEDEAVLLSKLFPFLCTYSATMVEIALISD